jgi:Ca2+-binding EF-hand superfamily protein
LKDKQNEEKLKSAFDQYDTDKSGHLSLDEFEKFASDFLKILVSITKVNAKAFAPKDMKAYAKALFDMTDTDKNGSVTLEEFKKTMQINTAWELSEKMFQSIVGDVQGTV